MGRHPAMVAVYKTIGAVSTSRAAVLLRGETGTGKELIARTIHHNSAEAGHPFIAVNCAAVPETLLESTLFGHVKGAFTGASSDRRGPFEMAGRGTLFLDEIGDTPLTLQAKLLRVLEEREFYPVGSEEPRRTEARMIAATNRNDVVPEYLATGDYAPRTSVATISNAMDVGAPSFRAVKTESRVWAPRSPIMPHPKSHQQRHTEG